MSSEFVKFYRHDCFRDFELFGLMNFLCSLDLHGTMAFTLYFVFLPDLLLSIIKQVTPFFTLSFTFVQPLFGNSTRSRLSTAFLVFLWLRAPCLPNFLCLLILITLQELSPFALRTFNTSARITTQKKRKQKIACLRAFQTGGGFLSFNNIL